MLKIKNRKIILITFAIMLALMTSGAYARHIGTLNGFTVKGSSDIKIPFLQKAKDNSNYVVNLDEARGRNNAVIRSRLYNSNYEKRSEEGKTYEGTRSTTSNWGKAGYKYTLGLVREYFWDGQITINGSWSPDNK